MSQSAVSERRCQHGFIRSRVQCATCSRREASADRAKALLSTADRPYLAWPPPPLPPLPKRPEMLPVRHRSADVDGVINSVVESYQISVTRLLSADRHQTIAEARGVACWLLRIINGLSYPEIGRAMRGRDHTTVMSAVKKVLFRRETQPRFAEFTDALAVAVRARVGAQP